jgi:hypothetical protein
MISLPPFRITGRIHLMPERDLHEALSEFDRQLHPGDRGDVLVRHGRRGPGDGAAPRVQPRPRAHPPPHTEVDPWHGLDRSAAVGGAIANEPHRQPGAAQDPWADLPESQSTEPPGGGWG